MIPGHLRSSGGNSRTKVQNVVTGSRALCRMRIDQDDRAMADLKRLKNEKTAAALARLAARHPDTRFAQQAVELLTRLPTPKAPPQNAARD